MELKKAIRGIARDAGFDAVGFASAGPDPTREAGLQGFLRGNRHGSMSWLETRAAERAAPEALWPEAKSVIVLGLNYGPAGDPLAATRRPKRGAISVYAQGRDYHDVVKKRLKLIGRRLVDAFECQIKVFVDTAPVMEKPLAQAAGIGWQGKHTNLVSRRFGSWLFLSEIMTTLEIPPDAAAADHCGSCRRCQDACPTGALAVPYQIDARRCISYLTIEMRETIPADLAPGLGNRIYGCDDCLAVCPWNRFASPTAEDAFLPRLELTRPRLTDLATLDDASFRALFSGSPIKRTGRERFVRNVLVAIANSGDATLSESARALLDDPSDLVRNAAENAMRRLTEKEKG